jgi:glycosyltransferase involved in cell wall biosynthesis
VLHRIIFTGFMLSVLVVSPDPAVPGGVSVFIECMKRHVERSRIDSFFVGSSGRGDEGMVKTLMRLVTAPVQLAQRVRQRKIDVVHLNPSFDAKALIRDGLLVLALRAVGFSRILFYIHGWDGGLCRRIQRTPLLRLLTAWVLNKCALITVLGDDFGKGLVSFGIDPERIAVTRTMFEGAELTVIDNLPPKTARPYILFMSRFDREKGGRELMQAFANLAADYPALDLVMAGDGEDAGALRALAPSLEISGRVMFTGYIGGAEKWRALRDCAIFALPTYYRSEGMPVAVLEAMGAGKPLLVGSAGALRSLVAEPDNGIILDDVTAHTIEAGLRRLLDDPAFAAKAGQHNRETAWAMFNAPVVTAAIENFYEKVAAC